jgi:carbonic anhydrase
LPDGTDGMAAWPAVTVFDELLAANADYAQAFELDKLPAPPARHLALVMCMDARILPLDVFGLAPGDAHVIRNAGGRVTDDTIRSLLVSTHVLKTNAVAVVHHTECGMVTTDDTLRAAVEQATGLSTEGIEFHAIADPDADLRGDVERVRSCTLLPEGTVVAGLRYDVRTGLLTQVVAPVVVGGAAAR